MQRVLSLNQALVESFAEPLILATCQQQQQQQQKLCSNAAGNAPVREVSSTPERPGPNAEWQKSMGGTMHTNEQDSCAVPVHPQYEPMNKLSKYAVVN